MTDTQEIKMEAADIVNTDTSGHVELTKKDRFAVFRRTWACMAGWNYERMQNIGWCYAMMPAMKKLYKNKDDQVAFMKRHLEFFNTHPYIAEPIWGVELSLEEERANGAPVDDATIQGVKIGMMGPLAGVGDPIFWGTLRPILGALAASLAITGNILGPILFFVLWNVIRIAFKWYSQEFGYRAGQSITKDLTGGLLQKVTMGASILGMFIMGVLIPRWTTVNLSNIIISKANMGTLTDKFPAIQNFVDQLNGMAGGVTPDVMQKANDALQSVTGSSLSIANGAAAGADPSWVLIKTTTLQSVVDSLIPGICALLLTFLCMFLLKKKVNPIVIILGLFAVGILGALIGIF